MSTRHLPSPSTVASRCMPCKDDELAIETSPDEPCSSRCAVLPLASRRTHPISVDCRDDHVFSSERARPVDPKEACFNEKIMRRLIQSAAAALLLLAIAPAGVAQLHLKREKPPVEDLSWMWQYTQLETARSQENALLQDARFKSFVENHLKAPQTFWGKNKTLSDVVLEFLGVPGQVIGDDNRYLNADGCVPHFCPDRGLLWVDLGPPHPLVAFAAIDWISDNRTTDQDRAAYTLWLFSNRSLDPAHIPAALTRSISRWTSHPSSGDTHLQNITRVFFVDPDGTPHPVTPSAIGAHNELPPETTTESNPASSTTPKANS